MSSGVRTSHTPNFSFHRSSTPMPYSLGNPALNCCGGSFSTFGNMKRPVAAKAAADAAENAPHARPIQARRVSNGEESSGSRPAAATAGFAAERAAAAPPADARVVVLPARSGMGAAAGRGGGAGRAGPAATAGAPAGAPGAAVVGFGVGGAPELPAAAGALGV